MDTSDTLQGGMVAPAGVTASVPKTGKDFSRTPNPAAQPNRSRPANHRPPPCANSVAPPPTPPHCEHHHEASRTGEKHTTTGAATPEPSGREPPPPPSCRRGRRRRTDAVAVRTRQRDMPGHPWPSQARSGPVKSSPATLQQAGNGAASAQPLTAAPPPPEGQATDPPHRRPA